MPTVQTLLQGLPSLPQDKLQVARVDRISFSHPGSAPSLEVVHKIVTDRLAEAFPGPEAEDVAPEALLYPSGATPQDVAGTIFRGVSQVIFGAYSRAHPEMSEQDLETFIADVGRGIQNGFTDARDTLDSMESLSGEVDTAIDETQGLLHERLQGWFAELRAGQDE